MIRRDAHIIASRSSPELRMIEVIDVMLSNRWLYDDPSMDMTSIYI